ncbi:hypothetical protein Aspvir_009328 [Aspergillus viridinutans]|uniref:Uncharacterized protein n=1 Tax=Aspergillus viridinutans TaxID=75553 RepID=A0A9P3BZT9_ASPVI|nr:uncharacterized protein Aspvir_009328 [Aspergillus viridinutans]GIK05224.1 hypothetical protein Aspvir_009328 [Aspergillus viridinutans]
MKYSAATLLLLASSALAILMSNANMVPGKRDISATEIQSSQDDASVDQKFYLDPIVGWLYGPDKPDRFMTENMDD